MRLLKWTDDNQICLTQDLHDDDRPPYAILSHTWAQDNSQEVAFAEVETAGVWEKPGYEKIRFCAEQARKDGIEHFWVDSCCIDKTNHVELSKAITSMYRWYQDAVKCYVYLADVSSRNVNDGGDSKRAWESEFGRSRWFTRGWTLQELLAPRIVEFFSCERDLLGDKNTLASQICRITKIPASALDGMQLTQFSTAERMQWAENRATREYEDKAYCLLGIFDVSMPVIYGEGEKQAFRRLQREIRDRAGNTNKPSHVHWMVPRTASALFTGRQDLLQELEDTVRDAVYCEWDRTQCRIVISGIGGQGKSEICLQLARRLRPLFWAVIWIDVSTKDNAERSFLEAARRLAIPAHDWEDALDGIANLQNSWLLVIDNADDPEVDYRQYLPDSQHGVILMTTRNDECNQYSTDQSVALEGLSASEAEDLMLKAARIPPEQHHRYAKDARQVAALLQSHPLALIQASAYISRGHCSLADYVRVYETQRRRLLTFRPVQARSRYGDVYATFEVSAEMLQKLDSPTAQDALQLLPLLAVCGPSQLPLFLFEIGWQGAQKVRASLANDAEDDDVRLLTPWHVAHLPPLCDASGKKWDAYRLVEAINLLKAFSLVSLEAQNEAMHVSLHALVHAWARDRQEHQQQHELWLQMGCLIACALRSRKLSQKQTLQLQPHVEELVRWSMSHIFSAGPKTLIARILVRCGLHLSDQCAHDRLSALLEEIFESLGLEKLKVQHEWIGLYDLAAQNYDACSRTQDALSILKQVVEIRQETLAADDQKRMTAEYRLAVTLRNDGQIKDALLLLEQVVKIREETLAEDDDRRLAPQFDLAITYQANGQVKKAVALLEHVVETEIRTLPADDRSLQLSLQALAESYQANGQLDKALPLLEKVLDVRKQNSTENSSSQLDAQHALAVAYQFDGQLQKAETLLKEMVEIEKHTLPPDHRSLLATKHELAGIYQNTGRVREAIQIFQEIIEIRKRTVPVYHPSLLASQARLSVAYWVNEQVTEAIALMKEVVEKRRHSLATDHPVTLTSEHNLAACLWQIGEREEGLKLMTHVVTIRRQTLDEQHPDLKQTEWWIDHFEQEMKKSG